MKTVIQKQQRLNGHNGTNWEFRDFVTSASFHLTLGKTHIYALIEVAEGWAKNRRALTNNGFFIPGLRGLRERGLVWYKDPLYTGKSTHSELNEIYGLTKAGEAVIVLLKESGLYQEISGSWNYTEPVKKAG